MIDHKLAEEISKRFINNPGSMNCGSGKLAKRNRTNPETIIEAKKLANLVVKNQPFIRATNQTEQVTFDENVGSGTGTLSYIGPKEIKTKEDLVKECNIDETKWNIDRMIFNSWGKENNQNWQVKAFLSVKKPNQIFTKEFENFLETYSPSKFRSSYTPKANPNACLIINKQDEHLNKLDTTPDGDNDITNRFSDVVNKIKIILNQASLSNNLEKIIYVLGSDEFNSEWTATTTKGTPQQNIHSYQESFQLICDYEITVIEQLLNHTPNLEIKYIPGNHDEYVGWHLITWLQAYFKNYNSVKFDTTSEYTKYIKYSNTAMMFNHGDGMKPQKLASLFPIGFKAEWSSCDYFYIFTGDKHFEKSEDLGGIVFYQLPALSKANSLWDKKHGYTNAYNELTAFLIEENKGRTTIFKQPL